MDVSVIIVNYNTRQLTTDCIESVFQHTQYVNFEVIVVDNASTDGSVETLRRDKRIVFVESPENLGFGRANNLGYERATGKYVFLLNSDTVLLNNAIKLFYDWMERADEKVACVGAALLDANKEVMHSYGSFPTVSNLLKGAILPFAFRFRSRKGKNKAGVPKVLSADSFMWVEYVTGADLFVRRKVIEELGLFDPGYFMYYEETDMQFRYARHGWMSALIFTPRIMHLYGASSPQKRTLRKVKISLESCLHYCKKNLSARSYVLIRLSFLVWIPKILLYPDSWSYKRQILRLLFS